MLKGGGRRRPSGQAIALRRKLAPKASARPDGELYPAGTTRDELKDQLEHYGWR
ncbi:MAG TPA: hypothetical protein IAA22_06845 [Candidatus Olsenella stercoravium]|uniref:Uncharacterized protein n=1 Tax=Candidatus Olsenella stercoravium TaxID=2838713 RepID=A0A9D2IPM9_9ACTN|nr:hypothetical protein [Candidatus Olsenella stercoravium]